MARKARRFKLNGDTGVTLFGIPSRPEGLRLEPGSHYTTDDPAELDALQGSSAVSEVKIPDSGKKK